MKLLQGPKGPLVIFDYVVSLLAIIGNGLILESVLKSNFEMTGQFFFSIFFPFSFFF